MHRISLQLAAVSKTTQEPWRSFSSLSTSCDCIVLYWNGHGLPIGSIKSRRVQLATAAEHGCEPESIRSLQSTLFVHTECTGTAVEMEKNTVTIKIDLY